MDLVKTEDEASITVFYLRISEGEMEILADALRYLLKNCTAEQLDEIFVDEEWRRMFGASPHETREFCGNMYITLMDFIKERVRPKYLPPHMRNWRIHGPEEYYDESADL